MASFFSFEHDFSQISQEKFEKYLNDPKLNDMLKEDLGFSERKLLMMEESADRGEITWQFLLKRSGSFPKALETFLKGSALSFYETSRFVKKDHTIFWQMEPQAKGLKISSHGKWLLKKHGQGTRRIIEGVVQVEIPLVGKVIEGLIIAELKKTYDLEPKIQEKFYLSLED